MKNRLFKPKGFTLIELIVVVAVMGVLAAILIPTMLGYAIQAQVTSADTTASKIKNSITYFLTQADIDGYGFKLADGNYCESTITVNNGTWTITTSGDLSALFNSNEISWQGSGSGTAGGTKITDCAENILAVTLADSFPDIETAKIGFRIEKGNCCACYYCPDLPQSLTLPSFGSGGWSAPTFIWNNSNQGVTTEGIIVGTAPVVPLGKD